MNVIPSNRFYWNFSKQALEARLSELPKGTVSAGALNAGAELQIQSSRTGAIATFQVTGSQKKDGRIVAWGLMPTEESRRRVPGCTGVKVVITND